MLFSRNLAAEDFSLRLTPRAAQRPPRPPTQPNTELVGLVMYKLYPLAPSIFRASPFGRWVVTRSLADSDFHGDRPAVLMDQHLLWVLGEGKNLAL